MFRSILVPVDGSSFAEQALPFALSIARECGAAVHIALVHVPSAYGEYAPEHSDDLELEAKERERRYLDSLERRIAEGFQGEVKLHHLQGIVQETLTEEAARLAADLVVMNAHGWGYVSRALLGSVSDYLVRHLRIPVLLMHSSGTTPELSRQMAFRRILVPLDGSESAEWILKPAQALGGLFKGTFRLLRVVSHAAHALEGPSAPPSDVHRGILEKTRGDADSYLAAMAAILRKDSASVETHVLVSHNVGAAILQEASITGCDLIALSTHGRGGLSRLILGSVSDKVIRCAHTPVLVYHAPGPA